VKRSRGAVDADPAVVSLAWTRESRRPEVEGFMETARQVAAGGVVASGDSS